MGFEHGDGAEADFGFPVPEVPLGGPWSDGYVAGTKGFVEVVFADEGDDDGAGEEVPDFAVLCAGATEG